MIQENFIKIYEKSFMKNWKVLITICVLGCTRICAQETGANDTVSRHPLTHGVGIDFRPVYLIPTNEFFAGENAAWQPLRKSVSAHLKYSFRFHPDLGLVKERVV